MSRSNSARWKSSFRRMVKNRLRSTPLSRAKSPGSPRSPSVSWGTWETTSPFPRASRPVWSSAAPASSLSRLLLPLPLPPSKASRSPAPE